MSGMDKSFSQFIRVNPHFSRNSTLSPIGHSPINTRSSLPILMQRTDMIPVERIEHCIFLVRGHKVILDFHLAALYGVETRNLNKAVKRNPK